MNKDVKYALIGGAVIAGGLIAYHVFAKPTELIDETAVTDLSASVASKTKSTGGYDANVAKVQTFLNSVMAGLPPLTVDGKTGPATKARISEFQKNVGRGNPVTGTWGNITEGNALAVYGFTPFQGKKAVLTPVAAPVVSTAELVALNTKKALLINGWAHGIRTGLTATFREKPSVMAKILSTPNSFIGSIPLGQVTDVILEKTANNTYTWLAVKSGTVNKGFVLLSDVNVYNGSDKLYSKQLA